MFQTALAQRHGLIKQCSQSSPSLFVKNGETFSEVFARKLTSGHLLLTSSSHRFSGGIQPQKKHHWTIRLRNSNADQLGKDAQLQLWPHVLESPPIQMPSPLAKGSKF